MSKGVNLALEKKKEEVINGAAKLPPEKIDDFDDEATVAAKEERKQFEGYKCMVKIGTDGLTHVDKHGIPAAEVIMLQLIHGSENVVNIKPLKNPIVIQTADIQAYLRDYLGARYTDKKVDFLWGNPLSGKEIPLVLGDPKRTGAAADQQRAILPDDGIANGKRIA